MFLDPKRSVAIQTVLNKLTRLSQQALKIPEVKLRMDLLSRGFWTVMPGKTPATECAFLLIEPSSARHDDIKILKLFPLFKEDYNILPDSFKQHAPLGVKEGNRYASSCYIHSLQQIVLPMDYPEYLPLEFVLFHELGHALITEKKDFVANVSEQDGLREEVEVRTVDNKLLDAIGGYTYREAVQKTVHQMRKTPREPDEILFKGAGTALDTIFGPAASPECSRSRDSFFRTQCYLQEADETMSPADASKFKEMVIRADDNSR